MSTETQEKNAVLPSPHTARFEAVLNSRKRKVRGLWKRGAHYYAQVRIDLGNGRTSPRRIRLEADNLKAATEELEKTRTKNRAGKLPAPGHRPKFEDFAKEYLSSQSFAQKRKRTQDSERQAIDRLTAHLGGVRIDKIEKKHIYAYREERLKHVSPRTVNLDVIALRHVLRLAIERDLIEDLPRTRPLKGRPVPKRPLLSPEDLKSFLAHANEKTTKNAKLFRYYIRFLALTGAREKEATRIARRDVDFERRTVTIGADGLAKNSKARTIDFSPELAKLLKEITAILPPDTSWLFPSPQRGSKDIHAESLRESFNAVRKAAGFDTFCPTGRARGLGFHDLRHFFASQCVMAGIDFMTIAAWMGHSDGGVLVGKVYGHLADAHKRAAARKLRFFS